MRILNHNLFTGAIFLLVVLTAGFSASASGPSVATGYTDFRAIPGVTAGEIAAIEKLRSSRERLIVGTTENAEMIAGEHAGSFTALFCDYLTTLFGVRFEPATYDWNDLLAGLATREIDFTGELTATVERRQTYLMTDTIAENLVKIVRLAHAPPPADLAKERRLRYALLAGAITGDRVKTYAGEEFDSILVDNYAAAYRALKSGEADAFIGESLEITAFDIYDDITETNYLPTIYVPVSLTTQNPELGAVIAVVDKALRSDLRHWVDLYNRGEEHHRRHRFLAQLTAEERRYIAEHSTPANAVLYATEYDNYPISFYNENEQQYQGIGVDVLAEIAALTGLQFALADGGEKLERADIYRRLLDGRLALTTELIPAAEQPGKFLRPQRAYHSDIFALISTVDAPEMELNNVIYSRVGVQADSAPGSYFRRNFPRQENLKEFAGADRAFAALRNGDIDLFMGSQNLLMYSTHYREDPNYKINILFDDYFASTFGLNLDEKVLASIIDKALARINCKTISNRWLGRVFDYRQQMERQQRSYLLGLVAVLLLVVAAVFVMLGKLRRQTAIATAATAAKSIFLSNMSHEIRAPMNAIIGMTAIGKNAADLARKNYCLNRIGDASTLLLGIVNDVLDMAKIEAGKLELSPVHFSLEQTLNEIVEIINFRLAEKSQELRVSFDPQLPPVLIGDDQRLMQVIINLLSNAGKFTPRRGKIWLNARLEKEEHGECVVYIEVIDSGIGISPAQQATLFSAFQQADAGTSRRFGGTGLGLAIAKRIVNMMDGEIWIKSELGKGSTFAFTARLRRGDENLLERSRHLTAPTLPADNFAGCRLLLADDAEINREILRTLLEPTAIKIDEAANGKEAVAKFGAARHDIIFMDVQMPEMDGYAATAAIRGLPLAAAKTVPIIAMTGHVFREDIDRCLAAGMNGHLAKPLEFEKVLAVLQKYLNRRQ
ncbi:MAG: transporter substrate-binding domain-containing protein [Planctomycetota bacterium]|jgi:signal transduction histidine kinase/ActR/RegA family two-component response regulator|nr:transporter substrate-binding domain-containing protein [Planctomycetota bacterium]